MELRPLSRSSRGRRLVSVRGRRSPERHICRTGSRPECRGCRSPGASEGAAVLRRQPAEASAAEPANHTFTFDDTIADATGGIIAVDDIDPLSPIDTSGGQANASSSSVTAPSITTTVADTVLVGFFATADDRTFTAPSGMTERYDVKVDGVDDAASEAATQTQTATGATGTRVATATGRRSTSAPSSRSDRWAPRPTSGCKRNTRLRAGTSAPATACRSTPLPGMRW
jgi:hypothetical protein